MNNINSVNRGESISYISKADNAKTSSHETKLPELEYDSVEFSAKNKETHGKSKLAKIGTAASSLLVSGLGQLINGDTKSALKHFAGTYGIPAVASFAGTITAALCPPVGVAITAAGVIAGAGIQIHSIVDAYRDA